MIISMKINKLIIATLTSVILVSCSGYNKVLKEDDYKVKQEFATRYYENKQWDRSASLYEQIYQRYSKGPIGEEAYFRLAKSNYEMKDYYLAGYYFSNFRERFFLSPLAEEATFMSAMCAVKNSPSYSLDQTDTQSALNELQRFITAYPTSELVDTCNIIMDRLQGKLEQKAYESAKLYWKMQNYRASSTAFDALVEDYPSSIHKEEALFLALKSEFLLAQNSIDSKKYERYEETIKRCRKFANLFPNSKSLKEVDGYRLKAEKAIGTLSKN
jgi:outer membrane protein assembly factor BamD